MTALALFMGVIMATATERACELTALERRAEAEFRDHVPRFVSTSHRERWLVARDEIEARIEELREEN
jgi:hypothetical protein